MNSLVKKTIVTFLATTALMTSISTFASQNSDQRSSNSGVIRFTGAIVAAPCIIGTNQNFVETTCWSDSGKEKTKSVDISKLKKTEQLLPNSKGTQQFNWINKEKTMGIYTIKYD
ncbi:MULTISPECIES: hypothetical protein [Providencia]|jgi:type 1 fimbria pilin|uniref:hypothetical protein n=1 Tax=Providencia TaxID=586 RepID=UPI001C5B6F2E|nr:MULTISPECIES: hypothetical protein [Providencia]ELR5149272.1 hypothetical protein [Providencia rettgeri]MDR2225038.1 hypothetical protein [Providencia sp.]QXX83724.1 hypothetical protein J6836_04890 [Providencia sp. R33]